ncbi:MAG: hypothetical protein HDT43_09140 [Ruminococcaceae bacterium]|nr:hypothetical protein [Oscillospiraceae bacterium]
MKIQTKVERNEYPNNIERADFSSKIDERGVGNISGLKTANSSQRVKTTAPPNRGGRGNKRKRKKKAKAAEIRERQTENESSKSDKPESSLQTAVDTNVNTVADITSSSAASGTGSMRLPPRRGNVKEDKQKSKREKYSSAKLDSDGSAAIEMVQGVQAAGNAAVQAGGILRTAVKGGANGLGGIKTFVQRGVNVGSVKDVGRIATAVNTSVANAARDTGQQMLRTKIDKSTITDTGTETIKQGLTELRYADNVRKAAVNTMKAASKLKPKPRKSKYVNQRLIRKNSKKAAKIAADNMRKMIFSKVGLVILGAAAVILVLVILVTSVVTIICSVISSLFSWLYHPSSDSGTSKTETEMLYDYRTAVVEYIGDKQQNINNIVDGFVCDKRSYSPYSVITSLNQFGNKKIKTEDYNEILAILAVKKYREMEGDTSNMELKFTAEEIAETVERFYKFEYSYSYGHCAGEDCKKRERRVVHNRGTKNEWTEVIVTYYCDKNHKWLHGSVTNKTLDEVLESYNFSDREQELYEMYLGQINVMMGG